MIYKIWERHGDPCTEVQYSCTTEYTEWQAFSLVIRIGTPLPPHIVYCTVYPPPLVPGGHRGERVQCGSPNSDEGTDTVVL
jgi:hypothetical protein